MPIFQFIIMAISSAFETFFLTDALFSGDYLLACFWAFFLFRNLRLAYRVDRFAKDFLGSITKK